jgi:hypothetical protein
MRKLATLFLLKKAQMLPKELKVINRKVRLKRLNLKACSFTPRKTPYKGSFFFVLSITTAAKTLASKIRKTGTETARPSEDYRAWHPSEPRSEIMAVK